MMTYKTWLDGLLKINNRSYDSILCATLTIAGDNPVHFRIAEGTMHPRVVILLENFLNVPEEALPGGIIGTIWLEDGSWIEDGEHDVWILHTRPVIPEHLKIK